jgi:hypothetical protein
MVLKSTPRRLTSRDENRGTIRALNVANPFVPYEIRMASGKKYHVPQPDFVSISPFGTYVAVYDENEILHRLNVILIEAAVEGGRGRKRSRKAA